MSFKSLILSSALILAVASFEVNDYKNCGSLQREKNCQTRCMKLGFNNYNCNKIRQCNCYDDNETVPYEVNFDGECFRDCGRHCLKLGFMYGECSNGKCKCNHEVSVEPAKMNLIGCETLAKCYDRCQEQGFSYGKCVRDRCMCYKPKP
jgi:hypothetical protein